MLLIPCPYCGARPEIEFRCGGEAHIARPPQPAKLDDAAWAEYLFIRTNPKGVHAERWRHAHGCERFFNALRDTRERPDRRAPTPRARAGPIRTRPSGEDDGGKPSVSPGAAGSTARSRSPSASTARTYGGVRGDTLASALLANGVHLVGRSFKYHRPRGIFSRRRGAERAAVGRPRRRPRAIRTTARPASSCATAWTLRSQNHWPSLALRRRRGQRCAVAAVRRRLLLQDLHVAALLLGSRSTSRRSAPRPASAARPTVPDPDRYQHATPIATCWSSAPARPGSRPRSPRAKAARASSSPTSRPSSAARCCTSRPPPSTAGRLGTGSRRRWRARGRAATSRCCRAPPPSATTPTTSSAWWSA